MTENRMYPLTLEGLLSGIKTLREKKRQKKEKTIINEI